MHHAKRSGRSGRCGIQALGLLLAGAGALASAAPVASGLSAAPAPAGLAWIHHLAQAQSSLVGLSALRDFLAADEGLVIESLSADRPLLPRPQQMLVSSLLGDVDHALRQLQEGDEPEIFGATRPADPSGLLALAQQSRARNSVY